MSTNTWHGYAGNPDWEPPVCVAKSNAIARPHYSEIDASEFRDTTTVLTEKIRLLALMIKASNMMAVYTGAGLSTAAGIGDYASKAVGSIVQKEGGTNRLQLQPTKSHRVLAALEKQGLLKHWIQQNHDGLAQKAGYPFSKLNEIHGGWFDRNNPVVLMDGTLRSDLFELLQQWTAACDLCVAMGTSLCGMSADRCFSECCRRHREQGVGVGGVIINLQRTPLDDVAALRIFAPVDDVMCGVAKQLKLKLDTQTYSPYPPVSAKDRRKVLPLPQ